MVWVEGESTGSGPQVGRFTPMLRGLRSVLPHEEWGVADVTLEWLERLLEPGMEDVVDLLAEALIDWGVGFEQFPSAMTTVSYVLACNVELLGGTRQVRRAAPPMSKRARRALAALAKSEPHYEWFPAHWCESCRVSQAPIDDCFAGPMELVIVTSVLLEDPDLGRSAA